MARCRRYLNRKKITAAIPPDRTRYRLTALFSHFRTETSADVDRKTVDDPSQRGVTSNENELQ